MNQIYCAHFICFECALSVTGVQEYIGFMFFFFTFLTFYIILHESMQINLKVLFPLPFFEQKCAIQRIPSTFLVI